MTTIQDSHSTERTTGAGPDAATPAEEIPEALLMPVFILGLLIAAILFVVVLGFVGFSDLMPRLTPPAPTTFH
jgi:hypothetical protein